MSKYRKNLPQLSDRMFVTDGGLETTLVFGQGIELPHFASYPLLSTPEGSAILADYFATYAELSRLNRTGLVLETATWRASADWGARLGHDAKALTALNQESVRQLQQIRDRYESDDAPIVISGCLGPRGDGYDPSHLLTVAEAQHYHCDQIDAFAKSRADLVSALTITHVDEATGIVLACRDANMPVVISFTVETDGRLPSGQAIGEAIMSVDAATGSYASYFGINCAHPTHFGGKLIAAKGEAWLDRVRMVRANASTKSHAELDESTVLDDGNPGEFGEQCRALRQQLPSLNVLGGCCGTDDRHIEALLVQQ